MNFAIIPFAFVIGLASLVYAVSGRKWFTGPVRNVDTVVVREEDGVVIQETRRVVLIHEDDDEAIECGASWDNDKSLQKL
jgi:hypothetical protein